MKKIILLITVFVAFSCTNNITDLNKDTKNATTVPAETLFSNAQKNLVDQMSSTNVNLNIFKMIAQYWTETTYTDEANYNIINRNIPQNIWRALYRNTIKDFNESAKILTAAGDNGFPAVKANKLAIIEIMRVYTMKRLVDVFGNVPYTEALDINNVNPKYDDASAIYADLLSRLNAAIAALNPSADSFGGADLIYGGNTAAWMMFANSLKLNMGVTLGDAATVAAAAPNTFSSNADNAVFAYGTTALSANPLWEDLVNSGRSDFVVANTLVDKMNTLNDPREQFYFADNLGAGVYVGGPYGDNNSFSQYTHINDAIEAQDFSTTVMSYSQVEFLKAEAVAKGLLAGTAQTFYDNGVTSSIMAWGGTAADATTYLAQASVAFNAANWEQLVGTQAWIAQYTQGLDAWNSWRRLNFPVLNIPVQFGLPVPLRFTYPVDEQTLNNANWSAASAAIGGDTQQTKVFWDN